MSFKRIRGDTQLQEFSLSQTKNGEVTILDLSLANKIELAFIKEGVTIVKECTKDANPLTGKCTVAFTSSDVEDAGWFPYDIQVTWTDGTKTTFIVSKFELKDDVNKT